jgi:hypothetical protein
MIDISYSTHPFLYHDYEICLEFLKNIKDDDARPEEPTLFHVYSDMRSPKEALCIKSFLATQNPKHTKLILWSDVDLTNNRLIAPYKHLIELRIYDPVAEAKDTIMEGQMQFLSAKDDKHYLQSDLMRILVCHKYGGVFIDMDIVLLRDFGPLLGQEYVYMWGSETDFKKEGACATVLSCTKRSEFSQRLLEAILKSPIYGGSTCWGKDMFARMYREKEFPILPSTFFNTEWCINVKYKGKANEIQATWFDAPIKDESHLFLDAFAWHWHNTSWRHHKPKAGSKFQRLEEIMDKKLKEKELILETR